MKKHNLFKVVGISILVTVLLTWILPTTYYQYEITSGARSQVGLFDLFSYPSVVLSYFGNIALYILIIGGFYGILNKIGAYRSILDGIAKKAKGKEYIILMVLILLLSVLTSVCGVSFGLLIVVPFVISLVLLMGYDKVTAAMVTVGSIAVGIMGTTFASTYVQDQYSLKAQNGMGVVNAMLDSSAFGKIDLLGLSFLFAILAIIIINYCFIKKNSKIAVTIISICSALIVGLHLFAFNPVINFEFNSILLWIIRLVCILVVVAVMAFVARLYTKKGISLPAIILSNVALIFIIVFSRESFNVSIGKLLMLCVGIVILLYVTLRYASKNHDTKKVEEKDLVPALVENKKKSWPLIVVLDLVFLIMLIAQTSWTSVFGIKLFSKVTTFLLTKVSPFGFPIIGKILGKVAEFEQWGLIEISTLLIFASMIIGLIYRVKFNDYLNNALDGIKKAIKPAILVILIYVVLVIVSYNPIVLTITKPLLTATKGLNAFTMSLAAFITSIFNVDLYYVAGSALQYVASLDLGGKPVIAFIWQTMYGFATLFAPTSVILMAILSYLDVSYGKWIKSNWILILGMLACSLITSMILVLML